MTNGMTVPGECATCGASITFQTPPPNRPLKTPLVAVHRHQEGKEPYWTIAELDGTLVMIDHTWTQAFNTTDLTPDERRKVGLLIDNLVDRAYGDCKLPDGELERRCAGMPEYEDLVRAVGSFLRAVKRS